jgi:hypothetical protein
MSKLDTPEINISFFGLLLNFVWEIWQAPLFQGMDELTHFEATVHCTKAALGDVVILLVAFWIIALTARSRGWIIHPKTIQIVGFIAIGIIITMVFEAVAIHVLNRWQYAMTMPILPILGTGIAPILQWLIIPPIIASMMRRTTLGIDV